MIADPAPPRFRGTTDITDSVAAGMTVPIPAPWMKNVTSSTQIGVLVPSSR